MHVCVLPLTLGQQVDDNYAVGLYRRITDACVCAAAHSWTAGG